MESMVPVSTKPAMLMVPLQYVDFPKHESHVEVAPLGEH